MHKYYVSHLNIKKNTTIQTCEIDDEKIYEPTSVRKITEIKVRKK